jgi:hypothetical protein
VADFDLLALLSTLSPSAREHLLDVLIRDQADRDAVASKLMRYRDRNGQDWADIIDFLTMHPDPCRTPTPLSARRPSSRRALDGRIGAMSGELSPL